MAVTSRAAFVPAAFALSLAAGLCGAAPAWAVYHGTDTPPEQADQIPGKTIKLDTNTETPPPSTIEKKPVKPKEREVTRRRSPRDDGPPERGASPDAARALGTMLGAGAAIGLGIGMHHGD